MEIYNILEEFSKLYYEIEQEDGVIEDDTLTRLNINYEQKDDALKQISLLVLKARSEQSIIKLEIERLNKLKKIAELKEDRFIKLIKTIFETYNLQKAELGTVNITTRASKSVDIFDETLIPKDLCTVKYTPSKSEIKKLLDAGISVEGAKIVENTNINIK